MGEGREGEREGREGAQNCWLSTGREMCWCKLEVGESKTIANVHQPCTNLRTTQKLVRRAAWKEPETG